MPKSSPCAFFLARCVFCIPRGHLPLPCCGWPAQDNPPLPCAKTRFDNRDDFTPLDNVVVHSIWITTCASCFMLSTLLRCDALKGEKMFYRLVSLMWFSAALGSGWCWANEVPPPAPPATEVKAPPAAEVKAPPAAEVKAPPPGVAVCPSSAAPPASNPWLNAKLYGNDNNMAALRAVSIEAVDGGFVVTIKNQFHFKCGLSFDAQGNPEYLCNCRSFDEDGAWSAKESKIRLKCSTQKKEHVCRGAYSLCKNFCDKAAFTLARSRSGDDK